MPILPTLSFWADSCISAASSSATFFYTSSVTDRGIGNWSHEIIGLPIMLRVCAQIQSGPVDISSLLLSFLWWTIVESSKTTRENGIQIIARSLTFVSIVGPFHGGWTWQSPNNAVLHYHPYCTSSTLQPELKQH